MSFRLRHHSVELLLIVCIGKLFIVQAMNVTVTLSPGSEHTAVSAPRTHFKEVLDTVTPTRAPETSTVADIQRASTPAQNTSANNLTTESTGLNDTDLSGSTTVTPATKTSTVTSGSATGSSAGLTYGKTSSVWHSAASTTNQTTTIINASEATAISATKELSTMPNNSTEETELTTEFFDRLYTTKSAAERARMKNSEAIITIAFSIVLGIVVLVILVYSVNKCRTRRSQYSHRPLHDTSYESADRYSAPEDTLVISGGLYDAPRVYNPTMTVLEDEECPQDYVSFGSRPGQFRLEFLPGEKEPEPSFYSPAFNTFTSPQHNL